MGVDYPSRSSMAGEATAIVLGNPKRERQAPRTSTTGLKLPRVCAITKGGEDRSMVHLPGDRDGRGQLQRTDGSGSIPWRPYF